MNNELVAGGMNPEHGTRGFLPSPLELPSRILALFISLWKDIKMSGEEDAKPVNVDPRWYVWDWGHRKDQSS